MLCASSPALPPIPISVGAVPVYANPAISCAEAKFTEVFTPLTSSENRLSAKEDAEGRCAIFVGDLAPEIENHQLRYAFAAFGRVVDCKIIKDMHTQKPKGYGFVVFASATEANEALKGMHGCIVGSRAIRTSWAVRKPLDTPADPRPLDFDEVSVAALDTNSTVYVGGIRTGLCEELLLKAFGSFGDILEVRLFKEKGYAFVRFARHDVAARAIVDMHGKPVGAQRCKCSWGKESNRISPDASLIKEIPPVITTVGPCWTTASPLSSVFPPTAWNHQQTQLGPSPWQPQQQQQQFFSFHQAFSYAASQFVPSGYPTASGCIYAKGCPGPSPYAIMSQHLQYGNTSQQELATSVSGFAFKAS